MWILGQVRYHDQEEEMDLCPACWLSHYLRSNAKKFFFPLGADSSSVAAIVGCMCQIVIEGLNHLTVHTLARIKRHWMQPS